MGTVSRVAVAEEVLLRVPRPRKLQTSANMISHILSVALISSLAMAAPQQYYYPTSVVHHPSSFTHTTSGFQYVPSFGGGVRTVQPAVVAAQPAVDPALMQKLSQLSSLLPALETLANGAPQTTSGQVDYQSIDAAVEATRQLLEAVPLEYVPLQYRDAIRTLSDATMQLIDTQQSVKSLVRPQVDEILVASRELLQALPQQN